MTDDDLDRRLHDMLAGRADRVDADLSGPQLRRDAARERGRHLRFIGPASAAAAVLVVAIALAQHAGSGGHAPSPVQPGAPAGSATIHPSPVRPSAVATQPYTFVPAPHPAFRSVASGGPGAPVAAPSGAAGSTPVEAPVASAVPTRPRSTG